MIRHVQQVAEKVGLRRACEALGISRSSLGRWKQPSYTCPPKRRTGGRALCPAEVAKVLEVLHEPRFADWAVPQIHATLLDEGVYLCSVRTMYRILQRAGENIERRRQRVHTGAKKPELLAQGPRELWSWDITKLHGPQKWTYYYLYVILDVFSRFVVGWMIAPRESKTLAKHFIAQTCSKQGIAPGQLTLHADRGSSMTSKPVAFLLADLGVTKTHSRPYQSNDNPFSEAGFKTLKSRPDFPTRFGSLEDARAFCRDFFDWYNHEHHHSGLAMMTPYDVHHGLVDVRLSQRNETLQVAYATHPERFPRGQPTAKAPSSEVWINKPAEHLGMSKSAGASPSAAQ